MKHNPHLEVVKNAVTWLKHHQRTGQAPVYEGYVADTVLNGTESIRKVVFDFLVKQVYTPEKWMAREDIYVTEEKDFKVGQFLQQYMGHKIFYVNDSIIVTTMENVSVSMEKFYDLFPHVFNPE